MVTMTTSRTIGQDLFHLIPLFADPLLIIKDWMFDVINEFNILKNLNVSLGVLDDVEKTRIEFLSVINNEYNAIQNFEAKKK